MKKAFLIIGLLLLNATVILAQEWHTDFETAKEIATNENKPIILVFQGSDWCAPCIKLDKEIWNTATFKKYAIEKYVMLQADFPRRKKNALSAAQTKANAALAEAYNTHGIFPFVVVLDSEGNIYGATSYKKTTPSAYIELLNSFIK